MVSELEGGATIAQRVEPYWFDQELASTSHSLV